MSSDILYLQGPVGPFFQLLVEHTNNHTSANAHHIALNGGDEFFGNKGTCLAYKGEPKEWSAFLHNYIQEHKITDVVVFGDCRYYHRIAKKVCENLELQFWVFEEGYLRPSFITLESGGVNGNSSMLDVEFEFEKIDVKNLKPLQSENVKTHYAFWYMAAYTIQYYFFKNLRSKKFKYYIHHRPWIAIEECFNWLRSGIRKLAYSKRDKSLLKRLKSEMSSQYFLVPLQVSVDSQILYHSPYGSVEEFISVVIKSFSQNSSADDYLVIKHHPMDRGFNNYARYITKQSYAYDVLGRVLYCHDIHLPSLLKHAKGMVTLNSTVGMSSLHHGTSTKVLGRAIYDIDGVTSQKSLDDFWGACCQPCENKFNKFTAFLKASSQIPGSFYQRPENTIKAITEKIFN